MNRSSIKKTIIQRLFLDKEIDVEYTYWPLFELSLGKDISLMTRNNCLEKLKNEKEGMFLFLILALNGTPHLRDSFKLTIKKSETEKINKARISFFFSNNIIIPSLKNFKECYEIKFNYVTEPMRHAKLLKFDTSLNVERNTPKIDDFNNWWNGNQGGSIKVSILKKINDVEELIFETGLINMNDFFTRAGNIEQKLTDNDFLKIIEIYKISREVSIDINESIFLKLYEYQTKSDNLLNSKRIKEQEIKEAKEFEQEYHLNKKFDGKYEI